MIVGLLEVPLYSQTLNSPLIKNYSSFPGKLKDFTTRYFYEGPKFQCYDLHIEGESRVWVHKHLRWALFDLIPQRKDRKQPPRPMSLLKGEGISKGKRTRGSVF